MKNRIAILQPSYIPWLGYFDQINQVDTFIFYDDVLYTKNDWRNRNKIKTANGPIWLTIPIDIKNRIKNHLLIKDAAILDPVILKKHLKTIELNYKKAPYFREFYDKFSPLFNSEYRHLSDIDIDFVKLACDYLGIKDVKFLRSSELDIAGTDPTDRLIKICKSLKATNYLTGASAKDYLEESRFSNDNISLEYQEYHHPEYKQLWGKFIPYMSIIDLLCNEGKKSLSILSNKHEKTN